MSERHRSGGSGGRLGIKKRLSLTLGRKKAKDEPFADLTKSDSVADGSGE